MPDDHPPVAQRPAAGTPYVRNLALNVVSSGFGSVSFDAMAPGGQWGDERVVQWLVFVGAQPVTLHFVDSDGGESVGAAIPALAQLTLMLCGIRALRFRAGNIAATVSVIAIPQVFTPPNLLETAAIYGVTESAMLSVGTP